MVSTVYTRPNKLSPAQAGRATNSPNNAQNARQVAKRFLPDPDIVEATVGTRVNRARLAADAAIMAAFGATREGHKGLNTL